MGILYKCLLYCCHFIISCWLFLAGVIRRLKVEVGLPYVKHSSFSEELAKSKLILDDYQKTPKHLGVILNEDTFYFMDIANIIVWCLAVGVPYVSIYDLEGFVKLNKFKFYRQVVTAKGDLLKRDAIKYKIHTYCSSLKDDFENDIQNGHIYEGEVHVTLLSREDGKTDIVHGIRNLCKDVVKGKLKPSDVKQFHVSKYLNALPGFPDPDVLLCFGRGRSLIGYLPWHIRTSEIMFFPTHHKFQFRDFVTVLELFNHCEQRLGK